MTLLVSGRKRRRYACKSGNHLHTTRDLTRVFLALLREVGATMGSVLAFALGRFVLQEQAQGLFNKFKILKAVDRVIETQGLKLVILLRLSPIVPFSAFNYVMYVSACPH